MAKFVESDKEFNATCTKYLKKIIKK